MTHVPTTTDVLPGARVNIVMKQDQPTGRTVSGVVAQLLTRGDHPRGIKVRLTDGRVGRVQSMAMSGAREAPSYTPEPQDTTTVSPACPLSDRPSRYGCRRGGARGHGQHQKPLGQQAVLLEAYIRPSRKQGKGPKGRAQKAGSGSALSENLSEQETACPVCRFRGVAAAVTHHVQSHFDD
ncbi:uncharacterized protein CTHT_0050100 [Thermochaetoides thermophila DSM 1495]|uniref:Uncharacterized protein n=1 Tax=Chaetomium thermophilum (strain DSM 1495 / CBS 144.50 / IMI 039719) TaxID=759272 RepID=G0SBF6_CHATD|nr:hypothetical protein CTHT_0050100 [Thermochaetoides thermophila DSM 1495]EGS19536.1 hypothetical protein CTHT_0050100 [Thermochaetoides thermophila DSM 1495]